MPDDSRESGAVPLRRLFPAGGVVGHTGITIHGVDHGIDITGGFRLFPLTDDEKLDAAFDKYVARRPPLSPWLIERVDAGLESAQVGIATLPATANTWPRLESGLFAGMLSDDHGNDYYVPDVAFSGGQDAAFAFAVEQTGDPAEAGGGVFNRATLTLTVRAGLSASLAHAAASMSLRPVPDVQLRPTLIVPAAAQNGSSVNQSVPGTATPNSDGTYSVTFNLTGALVKAAYIQLTRRGQASISTEVHFSGYQAALVTVPDVGFAHAPTFDGYAFQVFGDGGNTAGSPLEPVNPFPGRYHFFPVTASLTRSIALGMSFDTDAYRSRFTVTLDGRTRPIIDERDFDEFAGPRTEYRQLTSLDVGKYRSLERLYFGQVSGTVVAVPSTYAIQRTRAGLAARCDALIDDSPTTLTGSRFQFTFTVAPSVDPVDMTQLRADVASIPEAAGRTLRVQFPDGLDARNPSSLNGFASTATSFADSQGPAVTLAVTIGDDHATPATSRANLFLHQLTSALPAPLFGSVGVRLDDDYPDPVQSAVVLNVHQTADGDDVQVSRASLAANVSVANLSPLDLVLHRCATATAATVTISDLQERPLPAGQSTELAVQGEASAVTVSRELLLATPVPKSEVLKLVTFHTETVQSVQHPLTVNAAGLNFAAGAITVIDIQFALTDLPAVTVPGLTLSPSHLVDFTHANVPVDALVTGLAATVTLTVTMAAQIKTVTLGHDFLDEPILVLTPATLG